MPKNKLTCDVTFIVGSEGLTQTIAAHKYVLTSRSSVSFAMLCGELASRNGDVIPITDVPPDAFNARLSIF